MGRLAFSSTILMTAAGILSWVNRGAPEPYSWAEVLPFSSARPHTNLYRAAFFLVIALFLKALRRIPNTDQALLPLLRNILPPNPRRGFWVIALSIIAVVAGWWVSANSRLPDFFECPPFHLVPTEWRLEFIQAAAMAIVLGSLYLILFLHGHHAKVRQDTTLRYADNQLIWKRREQALDPIPPVGHGKPAPPPSAKTQ